MKTQIALMPALVVCPLIIVCGFALAKVNFIFPAHSTMSIFDLVAYCLLPGIALILASGLGIEVFTQIRGEYRTMRSQPFYLFATAMGQPIDQMMRHIVLAKGMMSAWSRSLPWLFGELVVVEAMFNAPGLGYHSWMYAKLQNYEGMAGCIILLIGMYALLSLGAGYFQRWIGRRLESYH